MTKKWNFLKYLDMYGQPIQFSYYGDSKFTSSCGLFVSLFVIFLITYYSICLIISVIAYNKPKMLTTPDTIKEPYNYQLISDIPGLFNVSSSYLTINKNLQNNTAQFALSVGVQDLTFNYLPFDPRYFILKIGRAHV